MLLLDDGFQHVKLARNFDVVLVDALNPFGGGEVFPMGRLREPVQGLARADAIVITRSEVERSGAGDRAGGAAMESAGADLSGHVRAPVVGGASYRAEDSRRRR